MYRIFGFILRGWAGLFFPFPLPLGFIGLLPESYRAVDSCKINSERQSLYSHRSQGRSHLPPQVSLERDGIKQPLSYLEIQIYKNHEPL